METISVGEAQNRLLELISRAASGEHFVIQLADQPAVTLISAVELERLEHPDLRATGLARALGQDEALLKRIESGDLHPAMAAFGLWRDEADLVNLTDEIYANRETTIC